MAFENLADHVTLVEIDEQVAAVWRTILTEGQLARRHGFQYAPVAMQNTHLAKMTELLIGRNLDWMEN